MDKGKEKRGSEDDGYTQPGGEEEVEEVEEEVQPQVTVAGTTGVKRWVVDLDLPPEERWSEVVAFHAPDLLAVAQHIRSELAQMLGKKKATFGEKVVGAFLAGAAHAGVVFYGQELAGIAKVSGLPLGQLVLLQLVYEASAACTSIVVPQDPTQDSTPQHIRTMDWGMEFLKPLTIEVDFVKGGRSQYVATTWVGYVGVLTGMRPFGYSVSVNFRVTSGAYWKNVKKAILRAWPIGFLVREVLESEVTYKRAAAALAQSELIAPVYFTVCGVQPGEGVLLTRDREGDTRPYHLAEHGSTVQTNIDHWSEDPDEDIMWSIQRRAIARKTLQSLQRKSEPITEEVLWKLMSTTPILNELTLSGTYMLPAKGILRTRLPQSNHSGFTPTRRPLPQGGEERLPCGICGTEFLLSLNPTEDCAHVGEWHSSFEDCSYIKCGLGLKTSIGLQHWSCCFATSRNSKCPKSGTHDADAKLASA